jgi:hypothetical protein
MSMPKPAHTRVTWSGIYGTPEAPLEEWQINLNMGEGVFASSAARGVVAQSMAEAWLSKYQNLTSPQARLTRCRVAQVGVDGLVTKSEDGQYNQADAAVNYPGSGSGPSLPFQTALCISLMTARPGPTGRGRFYLAAPALTLGLDGRLTTAQQDAFATKSAEFILAVDAAWASSSEGASPGGNVVVASSKGYASVVTGIRVGRVPDTQTRRRGDLLEEYKVLPVAQ